MIEIILVWWRNMKDSVKVVYIVIYSGGLFVRRSP